MADSTPRNDAPNITVAPAKPAEKPATPARVSPAEQIKNAKPVPIRRPSGIDVPKVDLDDLEFDVDDEVNEPASPAAVATATAPEPVPVPAPAAAVSRHAPRLLRMAKMVGIPDVESEQLTSEQLLAEIDLAQRELDLTNRIASNRRQPEPEKPVVEEKEPLPWGQKPDGTPYTEEDYAPAVGAALKAAKAAEKRAAKAEAEVARLRSERQQETFVESLERRFAERPDLFGKGKGSSLDPASREMKRRVAIAHLVKGLDGQQGSFDAKYDHFFNSLYDPLPAPAPAAPPPAPKAPAKPAAAVEEEEEVPVEANGHAKRFTEEDFRKGAIAKPTQRKQAPEPKGLPRARRVFMEQLRENGLDENNGVAVSDEESELPE